MQAAIKNRDDLLDFKQSVAYIEHMCATQGMSDEDATVTYKRHQQLRHFSYRLRFEASLLPLNRILLSDAKEACGFSSLQTEEFETMVLEARTLGFLLILTDVTAESVWVFA